MCSVMHLGSGNYRAKHCYHLSAYPLSIHCISPSPLHLPTVLLLMPIAIVEPSNGYDLLFCRYYFGSSDSLAQAIPDPPFHGESTSSVRQPETLCARLMQPHSTPPSQHPVTAVFCGSCILVISHILQIAKLI